VYDHALGVAGMHFTAFNMCFGAFGNISGESLLLMLLVLVVVSERVSVSCVSA
jgi:hypothetical protein